jgi:hypothetical protein
MKRPKKPKEVSPQSGPADIAAWRDAGRPIPDLQKLVRTHGGYDKITPEVWAQWDHDRALWRAMLRAGGAYAR